MRRRITVQLAVALGLVATLVIAGLATMTVAVDRLQTVDKERSESTDALITAGQLEQSVVDLETGLRGYLLAGRTRFLQPYETALRSYRGRIATLREDTSNTPRAHALTIQLGSAVDNYVSAWAEPLIRLAQHHLGAARAAEAGGGGKRRVDAIRSQFGALLAAETTLHGRQVGDADTWATVAKAVGYAAIGLFVLLIAGLAFMAQRRVVRPLKRLASTARRISRGELSARAPEGGTGEVAELLVAFNRMASSLEHQHDELERTAQSLAALLESTDEGIYGVDLDGRVTLVNRAALELTGFSGQEWMWSSSHELIHHTRPDGTPYPADKCPVALAMSMGQGVRVTDEVFWRKDGSSFPVEYSASPLMQGGEIQGAVVSFADVSGRRHLQRLREAQHALSRALGEASSLEGARPQMMGAVAAALGFDVGVTWEPGSDGMLRRITTYAAPGFEDLAASLGPDELALEGTLAARAVTRRDPVLEVDLKHNPPRPDGLPDARIQMAAATPVFGSDGRLISVGEMFARQRIPEDGVVDTLRAVAGQAAQYIERQRAQAETQRLKEQFVSTVSHELRTPLTAIDGWIHILLGEEPGPLNDDQRRFLETVKRNSSRLKRLVGDLLLAGQIDTGRFKLELSDVDVAEVLREMGELVSASAHNNDLTLTIDADEPVMIRGDRERLGQLIGNLLSNAIKYTPAGGSVEAGVEADGGHCRITVSDTGIGIPPADRKHLFERFYRASTATEHGIVGTGLGLAISATIAESHHGTIELVDRDGPGSTFVVELPLLVREEAPT